ncbi:hypothetical protein OG946_23540 [Streptomyces sp. NBC_01808]|uniref:hypothetical protein n=1 Tax=Streptomyces sp. NBC_01808 TaxID=2975947 RepID=UPI002DD8B1D9|nr:hypothetical protein [Streptomyces sp. NBC_01808]WSA40077.1 hypothetical protein OG946_23540 [Streptomyces sp. NBC_01808]
MSLEELVRPDLARQEAEEAARNLARQAERLGLPLEDIEVTAPCPTCRRSAYTIHLGTLDPDQTRQLANALRALQRSASPSEGTC